jgi:2-keto-4-pentenoate hydratase/2-oxohepta-3-ene-1,7-dioic acid hydratase in catechol pathway
MKKWLQFRYKERDMLGVLGDGRIHIYSGELFNDPQPVGETVSVENVEILPPCQPGKMLGLWNNFYSRAEQEGWEIPPEPLYFCKTPNSFTAHRQPVKRPAFYNGPVNFEGELGIVIGKTCSRISEQQAAEHIFGYTCVNDVTAKEILFRDASFPQWTRAKGFDSFGVFGPVIATGLEPEKLVVRSYLDGEMLQEYPVTDMVFRPNQLVSLISLDMTLQPGDVIACGTALGAGEMRDGQTIEIDIEGIGVLSNRMVG